MEETLTQAATAMEQGLEKQVAKCDAVKAVAIYALAIGSTYYITLKVCQWKNARKNKKSEK
jgi:hypothetical protein